MAKQNFLALALVAVGALAGYPVASLVPDLTPGSPTFTVATMGVTLIALVVGVVVQRSKSSKGIWLPPLYFASGWVVGFLLKAGQFFG
jgi:hypothetical protein